MYMDSVPPASRFLSTLSLRRATRLFLEIYTLFKNFYPRSPCGERRVVHVAQDPSPGRISIHALLAESDPAGNGGSGSITAISIHALLAESDLLLCLFLRFLSRISIHALLAESDRHRAAPTRPGWAFLSTLSLRRATTRGQGAPLGIPYFYPRSPCGERRAAYSQWTPPIYFYPRSPCGERQSRLV